MPIVSIQSNFLWPQLCNCTVGRAPKKVLQIITIDEEGRYQKINIWSTKIKVFHTCRIMILFRHLHVEKSVRWTESDGHDFRVWCSIYILYCRWIRKVFLNKLTEERAYEDGEAVVGVFDLQLHVALERNNFFVCHTDIFLRVSLSHFVQCRFWPRILQFRYFLFEV